MSEGLNRKISESFEPAAPAVWTLIGPGRWRSTRGGWSKRESTLIPTDWTIAANAELLVAAMHAPTLEQSGDIWTCVPDVDLPISASHKSRAIAIVRAWCDWRGIAA